MKSKSMVSYGFMSLVLSSRNCFKSLCQEDKLEPGGRNPESKTCFKINLKCHWVRSMDHDFMIVCTVHVCSFQVGEMWSGLILPLPKFPVPRMESTGNDFRQLASWCFLVLSRVLLLHIRCWRKDRHRRSNCKLLKCRAALPRLQCASRSFQRVPQDPAF